MKLIPGETYTMCEGPIAAGWTLEWQVDTNGDGVPDTIIPFVANVNDTPIPNGEFHGSVYDPNYSTAPYTNDTRCVKFKVSPDQTLGLAVPVLAATLDQYNNGNLCTTVGSST